MWEWDVVRFGEITSPSRLSLLIPRIGALAYRDIGWLVNMRYLGSGKGGRLHGHSSSAVL